MSTSRDLLPAFALARLSRRKGEATSCGRAISGVVKARTPTAGVEMVFRKQILGIQDVYVP